MSLSPLRQSRRLSLLALLLVSSLQAQTVFLGEWDTWVAAQYGKPYRITDYSSNLDDNPTGTPGLAVLSYTTLQQDPESGWSVDLALDELGYWLVAAILAEPRTETLSSNRWANPNAWSNALPSLTDGARITDSQTIELPTAGVESAASAKSLTLFDAGNTSDQWVTLRNGALSLTPTSVFDTALAVGLGSTNASQSRRSVLALVDATLSSSAFAAIGNGPPASTNPGSLFGGVELRRSQWYHAAGLIEIGGGAAQGVLVVGNDSVLAGSLLPGQGTDPRVVTQGSGSLHILGGGTARLAELSVNALAGPAAAAVNSDHPAYDYASVVVYGGSAPDANLTTGRLDVGATSEGRIHFLPDSVSEIGEITLQRGTVKVAGNTEAHGSANIRLFSATVSAEKLTVDTGSMVVLSNTATRSHLTIGTDVATANQVRVLTLGSTPGTTGELEVANGDMQVKGVAQIGRFGTGKLVVGAGSVVDIGLGISVGYADSSDAGDGILTISGAGAELRTQSMQVGYSYFEYMSGFPSPSGVVTLQTGGRLTIMGRSEYVDAALSYNYAGQLTIGNRGTLDLADAQARVVFADPSSGGNLIGRSRLTSTGTIRGSGTIDFGDRGGLLDNYGTIDVGHSPGLLTIEGDLSLDSTSLVLLEIGGTTRGVDYDALSISGAFSAGGTLTVTFLNGFTPAAGHTFSLFDFGSITGTFATINLPAGYMWDVEALQTSGVLSLAAIPEPSTWAALLGMAAFVGAFRRRREAGPQQDRRP